jgi:hypothetical protein
MFSSFVARMTLESRKAIGRELRRYESHLPHARGAGLNVADEHVNSIAARIEYKGAGVS